MSGEKEIERLNTQVRSDPQGIRRALNGDCKSAKAEFTSLKKLKEKGNG